MKRYDGTLGWLLVMALSVIAAAVIIHFAETKLHIPNAQVLDAREYCQMVHAGAWPDFHNVYKQQCHKDGTVNMKYITGSDE